MIRGTTVRIKALAVDVHGNMLGSSTTSSRHSDVSITSRSLDEQKESSRSMCSLFANYTFIMYINMGELHYHYVTYTYDNLTHSYLACGRSFPPLHWQLFEVVIGASFVATFITWTTLAVFGSTCMSDGRW